MPPTPDAAEHRAPRVADVAATWWPLAASWLFMALEVPIVSAALARLAAPEIQLASFGGIVYPVMLVIESPVIMLLAASTALSKDHASFASLRRYSMQMSLALTALHAAIAFTPLYGLLARGLIGAPEEIVGPARIGVAIALPWTASIAYRRFHQGVLIRHGHTRVVGVGTGIRLLATATTLVIGVRLIGQSPAPLLPGVGMATLAIIIGVMLEAFYIARQTRPVLARVFPPDRVVTGPVGGTDFLRFYVPLALTSLLGLMSQPIGSAALSRMPLALESLAAWPVVIGILFVFRSSGTAYKEVVVAMLERPDPLPALHRFTALLAGGAFAATVLVAFTPLGEIILRQWAGLPDAVADLSVVALKLGAILPLSGVLQNWYIGVLVHRRHTRPVTESMAIFLGVAIAVLVAGIYRGDTPGIYVAYVGFGVANLSQLFWVWRAARRTAPAPAHAA